MEPATGAASTSAAVASCLDSTVEYLLLEMIRYYSAGQDHVAAVHAVETMGFRIGSQLAERCDLGPSSSAAVRAPMRGVHRFTQVHLPHAWWSGTLAAVSDPLTREC